MNQISKKKVYTFKEWKSSKEKQKKPSDNVKNKYIWKPNVKTANNNHANNDIRIRSNDENFRSSSNPCITDNFSCTRSFLPVANYDGINLNNFNMRANSWGHMNNCFDIFNARNNFNNTNNFDGNIYQNFKNLNVNRSIYPNELRNCFKNERYGYERYNRDCNSFSQSKNFVSADSTNPQRDMMLIDKSHYIKDPKTVANTIFSIAKTNNTKATEVYITNPKAISDGKPYIPKPKKPEQNPELSYEEKKKQWKEYRQAMKPFKNRDFYNAKRVIQRLGKKAANELNEKELFRLSNAQQFMGEHKARLNEKYSDNVKGDDR